MTSCSRGGLSAKRLGERNTMRTSHFAWILAIVLSLVTWGCGGQEPANTDSGHEHMEHEGHERGGDMGGGDMGEMMKGLDPADAKLAMKQKTCPVSGEPLAGMGTPVKMTVGDDVVFLCCKNCVKDFEKDPQKYVTIAKGEGR
jgi:YHS domain-containing protein